MALGTVLVHTIGVLAVTDLLRNGYQVSEYLSDRCKANETCWVSIVDSVLPEYLLLVEVGLVLKWVGVSAAVLYVVYLVAKLYKALFARLDLVFDARDVGYHVHPG